MDLINNMNKHKMSTRSKTTKIISPTVKMSQILQIMMILMSMEI